MGRWPPEVAVCRPAVRNVRFRWRIDLLLYSAATGAEILAIDGPGHPRRGVLFAGRQLGTSTTPYVRRVPTPRKERAPVTATLDLREPGRSAPPLGDGGGPVPARMYGPRPPDEELFRDVERSARSWSSKPTKSRRAAGNWPSGAGSSPSSARRAAACCASSNSRNAQLRETLSEVKRLREQLAREREEMARSAKRPQAAVLEQRLRRLEARTRPVAAARARYCKPRPPAANGGGSRPIAGPAARELGELRRQSCDAGQLCQDASAAQRSCPIGETIEPSVAAAAVERAASRSAWRSANPPTSERTWPWRRSGPSWNPSWSWSARGPPSCRKVVKQQRELVEQRADVQRNCSCLRQLVEQQSDLWRRGGDDRREYEQPDEDRRPWRALVRPPASRRRRPGRGDPVVSSVMAQFARLQKDVAQRREMKK